MQEGSDAGNLSSKLLVVQGHRPTIISLLFLLLKLIKAFSIHNQYIEVPLFYKTAHQYFMVLIIYVLLQKQMEPYSTHVL